MPDPRRSRAQRANECRELCQRWTAQGVATDLGSYGQREIILTRFRELFPEWAFSGADDGRLAVVIPTRDPGIDHGIPRALMFVAHTITEISEHEDGEHTNARIIKDRDGDRAAAHEEAEASWDRRPENGIKQPPLSPESQHLREALTNLKDTADRVQNVPTIWDRLDDDDLV